MAMGGTLVTDPPVTQLQAVTMNDPGSIAGFTHHG